MIRPASRFTLTALAALLLASTAKAQPAATDIWTNYVLTTANWSTGANWLDGTAPSPTSVDNVLYFGSSPLQTQPGYTSNYTNGGAAFDVNSIVFNTQGSAGTAVILQGAAANDVLRFHTTVGGLAPSIWHTGTGRAAIQTGLGGPMTLNGGNLQLVGDGVGELQLSAQIVQGAGISGIQMNQTGVRSFFTGTLTRIGALNNSFNGDFTLTNGNLSIGAAGGGATGSLGSNNVIINGGSLQFIETATAIAVVANNFTLNQNLILTGNNTGTPGNPAGRFTGVLSGAGGLQVRNTSSLNFAFTGANTFAGAVDVAPIGNAVSVVTFGIATAPGTGTALNASGYSATGNSSITLEYGASAGNKLNPNAPITLNRGNLNVRGHATLPVAETAGQVQANGTASVSVLNQSTTANTTQITFSSLNQPTGRGTFSFVGTNLGSAEAAGNSQIVVTASPAGQVGGGGGPGTVTRDIIPYAFAEFGPSTTAAAANPVFSLVRWDSPSGRIVPLDLTTEYASNGYTTGTSAPFANHRYAGTAALPSAFGLAGLSNPTTVNSLVLDTNTSATNRIGISVQGTGTLMVAGGAVMSTVNPAGTLPSNPSLINTGGLDFGANPGYVHTVANLTINAPIRGSNGFVKSGFGTLFLNGINTFAGGLTHNSGVLAFSSDANLGAPGGAITLDSGLTGSFTFQSHNLYANGAVSAATISRPITVGPSGTQVNVPFGTDNLTLSGAMSGTGQFFKNGAGILTLTGDNSNYTGNIALFAGSVRVSADNALGGAGANVLLSGGNLEVGASFATNRDFLVAATSLIATNGSNLTVNGNFTSQSAVATLIKETPGDLILTNVNTFRQAYQNGTSGPAVRGTNAGATTNSGRTILTGPNGSMPLALSALIIGGGEMELDNTNAVNNNRIGTVTVGVQGGNLSLLGNAQASVTEAIGALSHSLAASSYGGIVTLSQPATAGLNLVTELAATTTSTNAAVGTVFVRGTNLGGATGDRSALTFGGTTNANLVNGVQPSYVVATTSGAIDPTDLATLQTVTVPAPNSNRFSIAPFAAYTPGAGALGTGGAANTYDVTAPASFAGSSAANAMRINAGGSVDVGAGGTLTLGAGAHILTTGGANGGISNGTVAFGANPARFTVGTDSDLTVSSVTTGTGGFVKTGGGVMTITTPSTINAAAAGGMAVGRGTLRYGVNDALPTAAAAGNAVFINSGAVLDLNGFNATLSTVSGFGNVNLPAASTLTFSATVAPGTAFGGSFVGGGAIVRNAAGAITLNGSSPNFTGPVSLLGGQFTLGSGTALGSGTPILLGNTSGTTQALLTLAGTVSTFNRDITVQAGSTPATNHRLTTTNSTVAINSNIILGQTLRLDGTSGANATTSLNGNITGPGGILIFTGNFDFNGNNDYAGGTTLDPAVTATAGIGSATPFGSGPVTFTAVGINLRANTVARTLPNNIVLQTGAYFGVTGTNDLTFAGDFNLSAATTPQVLNINNTARTTIGGTISSGTGGITKNGPGVLSLTDSNTFSGAVTVNAGTLLANNLSGSATGSGAVTVNSGAILGGNGIIAGPVTLATGGILRGGESPGILTINNSITMSTGTIFGADVNGNTPGSGLNQYSQVVQAVTGTLGLNGATLQVASTATDTSFSPTDVVELIKFLATSGTQFGNAPDNTTFTFASSGLPAGYVFTSTINYGTLALFPNSVTLSGISPVPEPMHILAVGAIGAAGLGWIRKRRAAKKS